MCGITGFWQPPKFNEAQLTDWVITMSDALKHRGPDDGGAWVDARAGFAMGNRRLAVIDLSEEGHQPMISQCGQFIITYNGEVYNYASIRQELETEGISFNSHSDTEVILEGCARWGIEHTLKKLNGMFAFALWDRKRQQLTIARDRLGIKPLYYGWAGSTFLFASELKPFHLHPEFLPRIDRNNLALLMRHNYIPAPYSIFDSIYKLYQGHYLTLRAHDQFDAQSTPYWSAREMAERGINSPFEGDEADAIEQLDQLLKDAVRLRMIADVPLGAFLSGGVDSSTVVALMQTQSNHPVKTFTIGFHEESYNEAKRAKQIATHLGTDHSELYITHRDAQAVIPKLSSIYDEPFSDSSQIPTYLVSQLAQQQVTVSL